MYFLLLIINESTAPRLNSFLFSSSIILIPVSPSFPKRLKRTYKLEIKSNYQIINKELLLNQFLHLLYFQ